MRGEDRWNATTSDANAKFERDRTIAVTSARRSSQREWNFLSTPAAVVTSPVAPLGTQRPTPRMLRPEKSFPNRFALRRSRIGYATWIDVERHVQEVRNEREMRS